jgi:hypothetical protein
VEGIPREVEVITQARQELEQEVVTPQRAASAQMYMAGKYTKGLARSHTKPGDFR